MSPIIIHHGSDDERPSKRSRAEDDFPKFVLPSSERSRPRTPPPAAYAPFYEPTLQEKVAAQRAAEARRQQDIAAIIAKAAKAAEEASKPKPVPVPVPDPYMPSTSWFVDLPRPPPPRKKSSSSKHKKVSKEEKEANKEKRLLKLIGAVVVKCMSKYKDQMDHEQFKKYAKEVRGCLLWLALRWCSFFPRPSAS